MTADSRPRHLYRLPDGREVPIIFDHGEVPPLTSTFQIESGDVVEMTLVNMTSPMARAMDIARRDGVVVAGKGEYRGQVERVSAATVKALIARGMLVHCYGPEGHMAGRMPSEAINARAKAVR